MSIRWIEHDGKKILRCDYRGLNIEQSIAMFEKSMAEMSRSGDNVLMISNFQGTMLNYRFASCAYDLARLNFRPKAKKIALVGIEGLQYVIREAFGVMSGRKPSLFETENEALTWLVN
ncbi:MAG: hypothetical protein V1799_08980 [bacterium]